MSSPTTSKFPIMETRGVPEITTGESQSVEITATGSTVYSIDLPDYATGVLINTGGNGAYLALDEDPAEPTPTVGPGVTASDYAIGSYVVTPVAGPMAKYLFNPIKSHKQLRIITVANTTLIVTFI